MKAAFVGVLVLASFAAQAQSLHFHNVPTSVRLSGRTDAVAVERLDVTGGPATQGNLGVLVTAPFGAQVSTSPGPASAWASSVLISISPGNSRSASIYLRSGTRGLNTWAATANGFDAGMAPLLVRDDALTCDVESGTRLDTDLPPGPFNTFYDPYPASSLTVSAAAAHRGAFGLRLVDGDLAVGNASDVALYDDGAPFFADYHARAWVRLNASNGQGTAIVVQLTTAQALSPSVVDVIVRGPDRGLSIAGFEADAGYSQLDSDAGLSLGGWHLVELAALGVGSPDGGRELWLDGRRIGAQRHLDFSAPRLPIARIAVGEPYAPDRSWTGSIDFDDVRSSAVPLASRLEWRAGDDGGFVGECLQVRLELRASFGGGLARVVDDVTAALDAGGVVDFFGDSTCGTPATALTFGSGATLWQASARARVAEPTVLASATDFLPATLVLRAAVAPRLLLMPANTLVVPGASVSFSVSGGTGRGVGYRLLVNTSGALVDAAGRYTAGPTEGRDEVEARDSSGQTALATVTVAASDAGARDAGPGDAGTMDGGVEAADAGVADGGAAPDGGGPGTPRKLGVGCGCTGSGEVLCAALLAALWARRRLAGTQR